MKTFQPGQYSARKVAGKAAGLWTVISVWRAVCDVVPVMPPSGSEAGSRRDGI